MTFPFEEYESRLHIDRHALDDAVCEQADLFYRVATEVATARDRVENCKAEMELADSETAMRERVALEKTGGKITEGKISEAVLTSAVHQGYVNAMAGLRHESERLSALRDALSQRATMLKLMAELYVAGYFTVSSTKSAAGTVAETKAQLGRRAMLASRTAKTAGD